jgi:hypothetical protein
VLRQITEANKNSTPEQMAKKIVNIRLWPDQEARINAIVGELRSDGEIADLQPHRLTDSAMRRS